MCQFQNNSLKDPTGTGRIRARAIKELKRRTKGAEADLLAFVASLERYATKVVVNAGVIANRVVYRYDLDGMIDTGAAIRSIINQWFDTASDKPIRYFFDEYISAAYAQGNGLEQARLAALAGSIDDMTKQQVEALLFQPAYQDRLNVLTSRVFEEMKDFSGDAGGPLRQYLSQAMAEGKGILTMKREMQQLWATQADYRLERIARTEIAHAHRVARDNASKDAKDRLGLNVKSQWVSQLAPTTRKTHAAQHLKVFELDQIPVVYSKIDGGEINCLCLQQSVIIAEDGTVLGERKLTKRDEQELKRIMAVNQT